MVANKRHFSTLQLVCVKTQILEHFSTSDHNMVEFQLVLKTNAPDVLIYKHDFNKGNYNAIKSAFRLQWHKLVCSF